MAGTVRRMDWSIFHALNGQLRGNASAQDAAELYNAWAIFALVAVAAATWFFARPGGSPRSKLAAASAGVSTVLALLVNSVLGQLWYHPRPFAAHPGQTVLLVHHGADNSFPSDHASVAFGVHYPVDVGTSVLVGLGAALVVTGPGRPYVAWAVRLASRLTDPLVAAVR